MSRLALTENRKNRLWRFLPQTIFIFFPKGWLMQLDNLKVEQARPALTEK
jgi:hypothetical protein